MTDLLFPWLEMSILIPLLGAIWVSRVRNPEAARKWCTLFTGLTLACALGGWLDFWRLQANNADDPVHLLTLFDRPLFVMDQLSAPLAPMAALLYLLTTVATLCTKIRRFSFTRTLVAEAVTLATLHCKEPWAVIALLSLGTVFPYIELLARRKPTRVYLIHMSTFVVLMVIGWGIVEFEGDEPHSFWSLLPLVVAILIRNGIVPFHCWVSDLFEHLTFGRALLFVTPLMGAYAAVRLLLPVTSDSVLNALGMLALFTAVYAAGMALVQQEARRFFCYIFLSHSALVLVGLDTMEPIGLTGALVVWLSIGLALAGFGLTLRALEARHGRLSLARYHGVYEHTPPLAICFLLTGMASVGFPGTFGFLGTEMLVDSAVTSYPYVGIVVVVAAAMNGIAVMRAYFRLFTGARLISSVPLGISWRERFAVLTLAALILAGGLFPQPGVVSRHHAAEELLRQRGLAAATRRPSHAPVLSQKPEIVGDQLPK